MLAVPILAVSILLTFAQQDVVQDLVNATCFHVKDGLCLLVDLLDPREINGDEYCPNDPREQEEEQVTTAAEDCGWEGCYEYATEDSTGDLADANDERVIGNVCPPLLCGHAVVDEIGRGKVKGCPPDSPPKLRPERHCESRVCEDPHDRQGGHDDRPKPHEPDVAVLVPESSCEGKRDKGDDPSHHTHEDIGHVVETKAAFCHGIQHVHPKKASPDPLPERDEHNEECELAEVRLWKVMYEFAQGHVVLLGDDQRWVMMEPE